MVGDVVELNRNAMARQDVPDGDAEGGPRKLDEGEHGRLYDRSRKKPQAVMRGSAAAGADGERNQQVWWGYLDLSVIRTSLRILILLQSIRLSNEVYKFINLLL